MSQSDGFRRSERNKERLNYKDMADRKGAKKNREQEQNREEDEDMEADIDMRTRNNWVQLEEEQQEENRNKMRTH